MLAFQQTVKNQIHMVTRVSRGPEKPGWKCTVRGWRALFLRPLVGLLSGHIGVLLSQKGHRLPSPRTWIQGSLQHSRRLDHAIPSSPQRAEWVALLAGLLGGLNGRSMQKRLARAWLSWRCPAAAGPRGRSWAGLPLLAPSSCGRSASSRRVGALLLPVQAAWERGRLPAIQQRSSCGAIRLSLPH